PKPGFEESYARNASSDNLENGQTIHLAGCVRVRPGALPPDRGCVRRTSRSALECAEAMKCPRHARLRGAAAAGAPHTAAFRFPNSSVAVIRCARSKFKGANRVDSQAPFS